MIIYIKLLKNNHYDMQLQEILMYLAANQIYIKQSHKILENKLNIEKVSFDVYRSNMLSEK
jgi:hypothetical protein